MSVKPPEMSVEAGSRPRLYVAEASTGRRAAEVGDLLAQRHPGARFVAVVSGDLEGELGPVLAGLANVRAEVVCVDALGSAATTGHESADTVLELGVGQDFVFTLPRLSAAIDYALERVEPGDEAHWEASAVLVIGPPSFIATA